MKNIDTIKKAKDNILKSAYGKFDYMEAVFGREYLINEKPRLIYWEILLMLNLEPKDVNRKTFYSWLARYKKERKLKYVTAPNIQNQPTSEKSWMDFEPTIPVPVHEQKKSLVRLVRNKREGQESNRT